MIRQFSLLLVVASALFCTSASYAAGREVAINYPADTCTMHGDVLHYDDNWDGQTFVVKDASVKNAIARAMRRGAPRMVVAWTWGRYNGQRVKIIKGVAF